MRFRVPCSFPAAVKSGSLVDVLGVSRVETAIHAQEDVDVEGQPAPTLRSRGRSRALVLVIQ